MSIIDDVRREIRKEQERLGKTYEERVDRSAEDAKNRIVYDIKFCIKHGCNVISGFPFSSRKSVTVEMPPVYIVPNECVTPKFSRGGENSNDCYFVKSISERTDFLRAVQTMLEREGVSCFMHKSSHSRERVLYCKYEWKE